MDTLEQAARKLQVLQESLRADVLADVYLFEEEWDQAISVANKAGEWNYSLIEKVPDAVFPFARIGLSRLARNGRKG